MPANAQFSSSYAFPAPGGHKFLSGHVSVGIASDSYDSSNTILDLSNHFDSSSTPVVVIEGAGGYTAAFEGTAASGRLVLYQVDNTNINGVATNTPMVGVTNATNVNLNVALLAMGKGRLG